MISASPCHGEEASLILVIDSNGNKQQFKWLDGMVCSGSIPGPLTILNIERLIQDLGDDVMVAWP